MLNIRRYGLATLFLLAIAESYAGIRYPFHIFIRDVLLSSPPDPAAKIALQMTMLIGLAVAGLLVLLALTPLLRRSTLGHRLVVIGSWLIVAMFGLELVSLHITDRYIYQPVGPFALCALVYFLGAALAACGALMERRRQDRVPVTA